MNVQTAASQFAVSTIQDGEITEVNKLLIEGYGSRNVLERGYRFGRVLRFKGKPEIIGVIALKTIRGTLYDYEPTDTVIMEIATTFEHSARHHVENLSVVSRFHGHTEIYFELFQAVRKSMAQEKHGNFIIGGTLAEDERFHKHFLKCGGLPIMVRYQPVPGLEKSLGYWNFNTDWRPPEA